MQPEQLNHRSHLRTAVATALALAALPAFAADDYVTANTTEGTMLSKVRVEDEVLVEASRYSTAQTTTATKTQTPLRDVPQSVSVVTSELIRDQSMRSMADIVRYVPGVSMGQGEGHRDAPTLRGNSTTADFFIDGVRDDVQYYRDLYNAERIEVLKGPNAMIFGRGGGGGVINRVTRYADEMHHGEFELQAGSHDSKRVTADVGEGVTDSLSLRMTGMYEDSGSYRDYFELERYGVNPTALWVLSGDTRVRVSYEHFRDERRVDRGVPSLDGRPVDVDPSTFFGNPALSFAEATGNFGAVTFEHDFSQGVRLRNHTQFADYDKFYQNVFPARMVDANNALLDAYNSATERENLFNQTDLTWRASTGAVEHTMLAGVEIGRQDTYNRRDDSAFAELVPISNPVTFSPVAFDEPAQDNQVDVAVRAIYVQDQIRLSERLQLIAGLRFDQFAVEFDNRRTGARFERDDDLVSPRAGVIFRPAEPVSLYASYSVSYLPSSGDQFSSLDATSQALEPEEFENIEVGVKWDILPDLAFTAALYQLDRTNTRAPGPTAGTVVLTGEQRSQGVELGFSGSVTDAWEIVAGYAFQQAEITRATSAAPKGRDIALVPEHQLSLWNTYRFTPMWRVGLGLTHQSDVYASLSNAVELPSFTRVDAAVFFTLNERIEAQLNIENLLDENYYGTAHNDNNITPGAPTQVRLGVTMRL